MCAHRTFSKASALVQLLRKGIIEDTFENVCLEYGRVRANPSPRQRAQNRLNHRRTGRKHSRRRKFDRVARKRQGPETCQARNAYWERVYSVAGDIEKREVGEQAKLERQRRFQHVAS